MNDVIRAFLRAFRSQLHPAMLLLALLPFLGALLLWGGLVSWYWDPLTGNVRGWLLSWAWFDALTHALENFGFEWLIVWLIPVFVFALTLPLMVLTAVLLVGVLAMPLMLRHICKRDYPELDRQGEHVWRTSLLNAFSAVLVFALGWLLTIPLWLVPPLALVLPFLWVAYLNRRILSVDAVVEHASAAEREFLLRRHHGRLWMLSVLCTLFCSIPPLWIVAPVFSSLAFAHYQLHALRGLRSQPEKTIH